MEKKPNENTLFLGNGFSMSIFPGMPSWRQLFGDNNHSIKDNTILYETAMLSEYRKGMAEDKTKEKVVEQIKKIEEKYIYSKPTQELSHFGELLRQHNIHNIITTNYDGGIEFLLQNCCGYKLQPIKNEMPERIYSVRRKKFFTNTEAEHSVCLWKIHGDINSIKSITLGYDQYCGALSKLTEYVKGNYQSSQDGKNIKCKIPMDEKCRQNKYDRLSWVELFFNSNVYIVGFGMDFSEIDIWWLLNKRARYRAHIPKINNSINFLYEAEHFKAEEKCDILYALSSFEVKCKSFSRKPFDSVASYFNGFFQLIE